MSASAPAPAPPASAAPRGRLTPPRLLVVVTFVAVGFVAVWQGFGVAGYGTDTHTKRVCWACLPLFVGGLLIVSKTWFAVRVLVALVALGAASWAWWTVRSSDFKSAMSLREAVESRDHYRALLATATVDDIERYEGLRGINFVLDQYPTLAPDLAVDYEQWKERMADEIAVRSARTPSEDLRTFVAIRKTGLALFLVHPPSKERLDAVEREWLDRAVKAHIDELERMTGDWDAFERTAPGRKALANELSGWPDALLKAEEAWVRRTFEQEFFGTHDTPFEERSRNFYRRLLALQTLHEFGDRFFAVRLRLFSLVHENAKLFVSLYHKKGHYDAAFGLARKHAVEWNAAATMLGPSEVKKLDELRNRCEELARLHAERDDVAPPPRAKPEQ